MNGGFLVALTIRSRSREWLIRVGLTSSIDPGSMAVIGRKRGVQVGQGEPQ